MPVKVKNVSFSYLVKTPNEVKALDDVSFEIKDNSITTIIGHTGSGKSTIIQLFNALMVPSSGEIEVDDFVITSNPKKNKRIKELRRHIASIFQFPEYQLFEETVEKDVAFGLKNYGMKEPEAIEKAHKALKLVGLDETFYKRSPFELSGGEKRRVAIAGILVLNPDILIMDEPTAGLDPAGTKIVLDLIQSLHNQGKTIILVTHDMNVVLNYATDVIALKNGKVSFDGKPSNLFELSSEDLALEVPPLYAFSKMLYDKGIKVDIENIRTLDDLLNQLKGMKHE
ncbi:MAG: energy-coupling factor transporter ATPase [Bacilli bacterium]|nr:energy-coupling factor transporter ATPase [Bacilli bacterium]